MTTPQFVVAEDLAGEAVRRFLEASPKTVALSGGSAPGPFYRALGEAGYDWSGVELCFGDERCVPPDHPDSNHRLAAETLLPGATSATVRSMAEAGCDPARYERLLREVFGDVPTPRFDLVVQGLGPDGHTASLFPGDPALEVADRWVVRVERPGLPPWHPRLTLTLPVLSAARLALFLVEGEAKGPALRRWADGEAIPAALVRAERVVVLVDPAAHEASGIGEHAPAPPG